MTHQTCIMDNDLIEMKLSLAKTEKDVQFIRKEIKDTAKTNKAEHVVIKETLEDYLQRIENNCAGKFVETIFLWIAGVAGTIILGALVIGLVNMIADNL